MRKTFNFSAGPAVLPEPMLQEAADEIMNYKGSDMSIMEISHRSALFQSIIEETEADLKKLMNIPDGSNRFLHRNSSRDSGMDFPEQPYSPCCR
jgi:phosphoserine aminotransferase